MYYTLTCPKCRQLKRMMDEVLPDFGNKFSFEKKLANSPKGMIKTMKLGIHSVPSLLIDGEIVFKELPSKNELINKLKTY